jgi:hypothetical protein
MQRLSVQQQLPTKLTAEKEHGLGFAAHTFKAHTTTGERQTLLLLPPSTHELANSSTMTATCTLLSQPT